MKVAIHPWMFRSLCQGVPERRATARSIIWKRAGRALAALVAAAASGCGNEGPNLPPSAHLGPRLPGAGGGEGQVCPDVTLALRDKLSCSGPPGLPQCSEGLNVVFDRDEPWAVGRYFLRSRVDERETQVCSVEFGPVIGAVIDTCTTTAPDEFGVFSELVITSKYDASAREISSVFFRTARRRVDLEILLDEDSPVLELHHEITVACGEITASVGDGPDAGSPMNADAAADALAPVDDAGPADAADTNSPDADSRDAAAPL